MRRNFLFTAVLIFVFSSVNAQWEQTSGPYTGAVSCIVDNGTDVFLGSSNGVFKLGNIDTWQPLNTGIENIKVFDIAFGTQMFAGTANGVYISSNSGLNWSASSTGLPSATSVSKIIINGSNILLSSFLNGIYISSNGGSSWSASNAGITNLAIKTMALKGTTLFAGGDDGFFVSTNNGSTWTPSNTGLTLPAPFDNVVASVNDILVDGSNLFAATNAGVYFSSNDGASWIRYISGLPPTILSSYPNVLRLAKRNNRYFASVHLQGLCVSDNAGVSWAQTDAYPDNTADNNILAIMCNTTGVYIATEYYGGVQASWDNGNIWTPYNKGLANSTALCLASNDYMLLAGINGKGLFSSTDDGAHWRWDTAGVAYTGIKAIATSNTQSFIGTQGGGVFVSTDSSHHWSQIITGLTHLNVYSLTLDNNTIYAGTDAGGVFLSTNNGVQWSDISIPAVTQNVNALCKHVSVLFAGTDQGLFKSDNNGVSWSPCTDVQSVPVVALIAVSGHLYAGTAGAGVFRSTDNGLTWAPLSMGLNAPVVLSFAASGNSLFAGTVDGVYVLDNNMWVPKNNNLPIGAVGALAIKQQKIFLAKELFGIWKHDVTPLLSVQKLNAQRNSIEIYPSVSSDVITLDWDKTYKNAKVIIYDRAGAVVKIYSVNDWPFQIDVKSLKSGLYLVRAFSDTHFSEIRKFIALP